jgi:hypothetical protein
MSWQITQGSTTVTLPLAPQTVTDEAPTVDDATITVPEQEPVLVSIGSDIRQLTLEGVLSVSGQNMAYLDTNYVTPLLGFRGLVCTLSTPRSSLNGTWKLDKATFIQTKDYANNPVLKFSLAFKHAANYVVL